MASARTSRPRATSTDVAHDGRAGLERLRAQTFDLVLLDVMMPNMDGLELCAQTAPRGRADARAVPHGEGRRRRTACAGSRPAATTTSTKPFHLKELLLRVAAILRRSRGTSRDGAALAFGGNNVDFKTYEARAWDGAEHALTHKEAMILKALAERAGQIVTREEILDRVWGYEVFPSTRTIDNFIVRLAQAVRAQSGGAGALPHGARRRLSLHAGAAARRRRSRANRGRRATTTDAECRRSGGSRAAPAAVDHAPGRADICRSTASSASSTASRRSPATPRSRPRSR